VQAWTGVIKSWNGTESLHSRATHTSVE